MYQLPKIIIRGLNHLNGPIRSFFGRQIATRRVHTEGRISDFYKYTCPLFGSLIITYSYLERKYKSKGLLASVSCATKVDKEDRSERAARLNFVADVVEEITPSVISIISSGPRSFHVGPPASSGSGFLVDDRGHVITNAHVVKNSTVVNIITSEGKTYLADVLAIHYSNDLALLKIRGSDSQLSSLPHLNFAKIPTNGKVPVRPGEFVLAAGSPLQLKNSVTFGVVSAVERDLGTMSDIKYIQTDATITFGNSGGPLINMNGDVVGVNTMISGPGLGFSIPVNSVVEFFESAKREVAKKSENKLQIHTDTGISRNTRYLGVVMATIRFSNAMGVQIQSVVDKSPASKAGLQAGDIIVRVNGRNVTRAKDLIDQLSEAPETTFTIIRGNNSLKITVKPEEIND